MDLDISKFQKNEFSKFIPNFPIEHVITITNINSIFHSGKFLQIMEVEIDL